MKASDIFRGQTYITQMEDKFSSEKRVLSPIKILAHVESFVIFQRDNHKQALKTSDFIATFIKACGYRKKPSASYELDEKAPFLKLKKVKC